MAASPRVVTTEAGGLRTLLAEVIDHVRALFRLELSLARQEAREALASVRHGLMLLGVGALVALLALGVLAAALVAGLATVWPVWLSALVVGILLAAAGGGLLKAAMEALDGRALRPQATLETIEETKQWLKART